MNKKIVFLLIVVAICMSCTNRSNDFKNLAFKAFKDKFKPLDLRIAIRLDDAQILKDSKNIDSQSSDTLFIKPKGNFVTYGYLKDAINYYALIYVVIGDGLYFRIATFDKGFNKIADTLLNNSDGCVPGTLCVNCNTTIKIKEDFSIQTIDSLTYLQCDSLGNSKNSIIKKNRLEQFIIIDGRGRIKILKQPITSPQPAMRGSW